MAEAPVLAMLVVGAMVAYMLDAGRQKELALAAVWITLGLANVTDIISVLAMSKHSSLSVRVAAILAASALLLLTACWASLQFRFLALRFPVLAHILENLLLVGCAPLASAFLAWAMMAAAGATAAPFYALFISAAYAAMFLPPLPSSYLTRARLGTAPAVGGAAPAAATVQTRLQCALLSLLFAAQPVALYAATHARHLAEADHLWSVTLLASGAVTFLLLCPRALWWLPARLHWPRVALGTAAYAAGVAALEHRVVLAAFGAYVKLPAPYAWIVVTLGMYAGAALAVAYFAGLVPLLDPGLVGVACIAVTTAGGISVGLPTHILPFALLAGAGLALYQESEQLLYYAGFVAGSAVCAAYFLYANFGFLDIEIAGMHLRTVCVLIAVALVPTLLLPGLVRLRARSSAIAAMFAVQALITALLEEHLHVGDADESFYPAYLVCATSAMGIVLARRLAHWRLIGARAAWALQCIYVAKLAALAIPGARLVAPVLLLLWAATPPLFAGVLPAPTASAAAAVDVGAAPLKRAHGLLLAGAAVAAVAYARFAVFDAVQALWGGPPPEGVLLGSLLAAAAAALAPLVYRCYPYSLALKRNLFLLAAAAAMLAVVRPPLPIRGGVKCPRLPFHLCPRLWDERHVPSRDVDDVNIYGEGLAWRTHWALWSLLLSLVLAVLAATVPGRAKGRSIGAQLVLASAAALCAGAYLALEFFPGQVLVVPFVLGATLCASLFLVLMNNPALVNSHAAGPRQLVVLPAGWMVLLAYALVLQFWLPLPELPPEARRLFPDVSRAAVEAERRRMNVAAAAAIFAVQGLLMALVLKLKVSAIFRGKAGPVAGAVPGVQRAAYAGAASRLQLPAALLNNPLLCGLVNPQSLNSAVVKMLQMDSLGNAAMARLSAQGLAWMPTVGNLMTLSTFALGVMLNFQIGEGQDEAILALAPLLLLLNQDPLLLPMLEDKRRYFPPYAAALAYLVVSAAAGVARALPNGPLAAALSAGTLLATLPSHVLLATYLWRHRKQSEWPLLFCTPLNVLAGLFGGSRAMHLLAGAGVLGAILQGAAMRRVRRVGARLI